MIATVILSFANKTGAQNWWWNIGLLAGGLIALVAFYRTRSNRAAPESVDLHCSGSLGTSGKSLIELKLSRECVLVPGIQREDGTYEGTPDGTSAILAGDGLVLYGPLQRLDELDRRRRGRAGDARHQEAVQELQKEMSAGD